MDFDLFVMALAAIGLHRIWHYEEIAAPLRSRATWRGLTCTACSAWWCCVVVVVLWAASALLPEVLNWGPRGLVLALACYPLVRIAHWVHQSTDARGIPAFTTTVPPATSRAAPGGRPSATGGACGTCGDPSVISAIAKAKAQKYVIVKGPDDWGPSDAGCMHLALHLASLPNAYVEVWGAPTSLGVPSVLAHHGVSVLRFITPQATDEVRKRISGLGAGVTVILWDPATWSDVSTVQALDGLVCSVVELYKGYGQKIHPTAKRLWVGGGLVDPEHSLLVPPALATLVPLPPAHDELKAVVKRMVLAPSVLVITRLDELRVLAEAVRENATDPEHVDPPRPGSRTLLVYVGPRGSAVAPIPDVEVLKTAGSVEPLDVSALRPGWAIRGLPPDAVEALRRACSPPAAGNAARVIHAQNLREAAEAPERLARELAT